MSSLEGTNEQSTNHYRPLDRRLAVDKTAQATSDLLSLPFDTLQAAAHTAVQTPINSLAQMTAPQYLPNVQIIDAPENAAPLSLRWHAQQVGAALGAAGDIVALDLLCRGKVPLPALGACYDGLMRPVEDAKGKDQFVERVKNAAVGAVGYATLYGSNQALGTLGQNIENATWKNLVENTTLRTTIAGIPAGLATTAMAGGKSQNDFAIGAYTSAIGGMGLGAIHAAAERQAVCRRQQEELNGLKSEAVTDYLTGLGNRRGCEADLQKEFDRSNRTGKPLSVIYGDLDGFKKVNDSISHDAGDQVLREVARAIKENLRSYDHASRSGGDEFTMILPETDLAAAQALANRLTKAIKVKAGAGAGGEQQTVGISLGVVTRGQYEHNLADFQKRADQEMYRIKRARKGQF